MDAHFEGTLTDTLGITFSAAAQEHVFTAFMPVTKRVCQPYGRLHGGAVLALGESLAGYGSMRWCNEGEVPVGQQVSGNHLHGGRLGETLKATATLLHKGRTTHVWNVDVRNEKGTLISTLRVTNFIQKLKSETRKEQ